MSARKHCETSTEAYNNLKASDVRKIYMKILDALKVLGTAHTERIAEYLTIDHAKIHKRVSEMQALGMIYKTQSKLPMKSGRSGYLWAISNNQPKTDAERKEIAYKPNEKSAAQYATEIIEQAHRPTSTQQNLFV